MFLNKKDGIPGLNSKPVGIALEGPQYSNPEDQMEI
jgi:hypothetical protein